MNNIDVGGSIVQVPAWASEETANRIVAYMSAQNKTDRDMNKLMSKVGGNVNELQREIQNLLGAQVNDNKKEDEKDQSSIDFGRQVVNATSGLMKTAKFFGQTEKPLSAVVDAGKSLASGSKKITEGLFKKMKISPAAQKAFGTGANIAVDALLAYAGWNAAKIEQFAGAQAKIIDSGVTYSGGAEAFDDLRKRTLSAGVSYTSLIDNITQFGDGMLGLGGTMSEGVQQFTKFYSALDESVENFGDLGLASKDMMSQYAEYITYARRTGMVNKDLNNSASKVNSSFIDLQIEAGAVANMTALTRQEAMRRSTASFDEFGSAAVMSMEQAGLTGQAETTRAIIQNLGKMAPDSEYMQLILDAFQQEAFEKADDPSNFDISGRLQEMMAGSETALNQVYPGFIDSLEKMMRSGDMESNDVTEYIFGAIQGADMERFANFNAQAGSIASMVAKIQAANVGLERDFGNLAKPGALAEEKAKQKENLKAAGKVTMEMNHMTRRFLEVQETLTLDMASTATMFNGIYDLFGKSSEKLTSLAALAEQETNNFGGIGGNLQDNTVAVTGNVRETDEYTAPVVLTEDSEEVKTAKVNSQNNNKMLTEADFEEFTTIHNVTNTVEQLNSLTPVMRERMLSAMKDFDKKFKDTDKKITVSTGIQKKKSNTDPDTWATQGMSANILLMEDEKIITDGSDEVYNEGIKDILANNNLTNNTGAGLGVITANEAVGPDGNTTTSYTDYKNSGEDDSVADAGMLEVKPKKMKFGGPVDAGKPYVVGDQLGMNTAELFVPDQSGQIVSNKDLKENAKSNNLNSIIEQMQERFKETESYVGRSVSLTVEQMQQKLQEIQNINSESDASLGLTFEQLLQGLQELKNKNAESDSSLSLTYEKMQQRLQELENTNVESDSSLSLTYEQLQQRLQELRDTVKATADLPIADTITDTFQDLYLQILSIEPSENLKEQNMSPPANRDMLKMTGQNTEAMNKRLTDPEISSKIKNSKEMSSIIANKEATLESLIALRGIIRRISQKNNLNIDIDMMNSR